MKCCECENVTLINGNWFTDCERFGKCWFGEEVWDIPEEQLDEFKENLWD